MNRRAGLVLISFCLFAGAASAAELFVDQSAAPGGDGSAAKPMQTINQAVKAAKGGDTITIRKGIYAESIAIDKSGTEQQPTIVRAAAGERVVISGFAPVKGWQVHREKIYTTTVDGPVTELFVGYALQPVSRWPGVNDAWRYVKTGDAPGTIRDGQSLTQEKILAEVAARPAAARLYIYFGFGNYFGDAPLTKLDLAQGTLTSSEQKTIDRLKGQRDRYQIINHVSLIRQPGEWAAEPVDGKTTRIYFWPANPADLERTQIRRAARGMVYVGHFRNTVSHVRIEGLEVTGGTATGIDLGRAEHVVVKNCLSHHNGGTGFSSRRCAFIEFSRNVSVANGGGLSIASSHDVLVQETEIALNNVDGLTVAGNVSGKPGGEPTTADVMIKKVYCHGHLLLAHPDNMQTYRDVERLTVEDSLFLFGGQGLMTEETNHGTLRNCVFVGTGAVAVIFGHSNASDWTVEGCTIGLGGWGALSMTAQRYNLNHNIFFNNGHGLGETITSDYNLYATSSESQYVALVSKPKWKTFVKVEDAAASTGQEKHSLRVDPQFRCAPSRQANATWNDQNTRERLFVRQQGGAQPTDGFAVGDKIEINGDGVLRRVTAVDANSISFEPAIPQLLLREGLIWNWKNAEKPLLDLRVREGSPALTSGKDGRRIGAAIDIQAYQRGDFDGDGKRELPEIPEDVKACWPNPNAIVLPMHGT